MKLVVVAGCAFAVGEPSSPPADTTSEATSVEAPAASGDADDIDGDEVPGAMPRILVLRPKTPVRLMLGEAFSGALRAQLEGLPARADEVEVSEADEELHARVDAARSVGQEHDAAIVLWLETREGALDLYVLSVEDDALYGRTIASEGSEAATVETLLVITRRAVGGILAGMPEGVDRIELASPAPVTEPAQPPASPEPRTRGRLRLAAGYTGTSYAREIPWLNGASLGLGWIFPFGLHLGAAYTVFPAVQRRTAELELDLGRHPIDLWVGYRHRFRKIALEAQVMGIVDPISTRVTPLEPGIETRDATRIDGGIGVRALFAYTPLRWLGLFIGAGLEVFPATFDIATRLGGETRPIVRPRRVRGTVQGGLEFHL